MFLGDAFILGGQFSEAGGLRKRLGGGHSRHRVERK